MTRLPVWGPAADCFGVSRPTVAQTVGDVDAQLAGSVRVFSIVSLVQTYAHIFEVSTEICLL